MSKSLGNIIQPKDVIEKYNRDYLRFFMVKESKGEDFAFDWEEFIDINRFFNTFWNSCNYLKMYFKFDSTVFDKITPKGLEPEDLWVISKVTSLAREVKENYNKYLYPKVISSIENFVLEDLSRTYIKLIRDRVGTKTEKAAARTLSYCIASLLKMLSPVVPHITEYIYQHLRSAKMPESIHMHMLPEGDKKLINLTLEKEMGFAKEITQAILSLREEKNLRLRWPLKEVVVQTKKANQLKMLKNVVAKMCNVRSVKETRIVPRGSYVSKEISEGVIVYLNVDVNEKMKDEWELRELIRRIQEARKQRKLHPSQIVKLKLSCSDKNFIKKYAKQIEKETNTKIVPASGKMEKLLHREFFIEL